MADALVTHSIKVSLTDPGVPKTVHALQFDGGYRRIVCKVYEGAEPFAVPGNTIVSVSASRLDGSYFQYDSSTAPDVVWVSSGLIYILITDDMTAQPERIPVDVRLLSDEGEVVGIFPFVLAVHPSSLENQTLATGTVSTLMDSFGETASIVDAYINTDGFLVVTVEDGVSFVFVWDDEGNVTITY